MSRKSRQSRGAQEGHSGAFVVAGYLRVSTDEQAESGLGIDAQKALVRAQATINGWNADEITWYIDDGVSGTIDITDRAQGLRLVQDIHAHKVQAVIVASIDRIGRKAIYILSFVDDLEHAHCQFASVKERIDTTTPQGKFVLQMFAAIAELERNTIAQRTQQALEARGRSVGIKAGRPPYAYRYDGRGVLIDEDKARIVRAIFALRKRGMTLRAIAASIESTHGVHIGFKTVQEILLDEDKYTGGRRGESDECWPVLLPGARALEAVGA